MNLDKVKQLQLGAFSPDLGGPQALAAEGLGSFVLVLTAAGVGSTFGAIGASLGGLQPALAPALALLALLLLFAPLSLGAFNPAVTLALVLGGRLPKGRLLPYAAAQFAGGLAAGLLLRLLGSHNLGVSVTQMPPLAALLLEALLTAWLAWTYLAVTEKDVPLLQAALVLSATLASLSLWAGPLSGASMNPARSLGPALAAFDFTDLWIYLTAPFLGAAAGARAYGWFKALR